MIQTNNSKKTDQAWERLYSRLDQDGLLTEKRQTGQPIFNAATLRWAASLAILVSATVFIIFKTNNRETEMLSLHNYEKSVSLVTTLEDGSVVYLAGNSTLTYPKHFKKNRRDVQIKGDAFFEITKNKKAPFTVRTDRINIEVLGTSFNVMSSCKANPSISVNTGVVKVTMREDGQTARLIAGETAVIHKNRLQTMLTEDARQFARYMERMHFKDERLSDVITVINKNMDDIKLQIEPGLEERLITASFSGNSPESMAQLICIALNLKYSRNLNTIQIHE